MSVASKNPFSLLDAEDSSRPASPAPKAAAPPAPAPSANRAQQQKPRTGPARGGKYYARGGRPAPRDGAAPAAEEPVDGDKPDAGRGGRAPRGARGAPRGGKRPFDRHSATGKTDSQKKVHQGWGGDEGTTELKQEQAADADATAETAEVAPVEGEAPPVEEPKPRVEEEEDNTLTLDQYLAQKAAKELAIPKLETRQANEGAGDDLWKDAVAISNEQESYFVGKAKAAPKSKAKKEDKVYLEIDARFERPSSGRGRGARGGDRGAPRGGDRGGDRRGRGAPRPPRGGRQNGAAAPNVDDQSAFPSLA